MEKYRSGHLPQPPNPITLLTPNSRKPVWIDPLMNCDQCKYSDQDVDTFPCAKCHTRD